MVSDPAGETELAGTYDDIFIPSSALNATVCGLVSRTFLRDDIIGEKDFHGAIYYKEYEEDDLSYHFIEDIEKKFKNKVIASVPKAERGISEVLKQAKYYGIKDINLIKPGIGETTYSPDNNFACHSLEYRQIVCCVPSLPDNDVGVMPGDILRQAG